MGVEYVALTGMHPGQILLKPLAMRRMDQLLMLVVLSHFHRTPVFNQVVVLVHRLGETQSLLAVMDPTLAVNRQFPRFGLLQTKRRRWRMHSEVSTIPLVTLVSSLDLPNSNIRRLPKKNLFKVFKMNGLQRMYR